MLTNNCMKSTFFSPFLYNFSLALTPVCHFFPSLTVLYFIFNDISSTSSSHFSLSISYPSLQRFSSLCPFLPMAIHLSFPIFPPLVFFSFLCYFWISSFFCVVLYTKNLDLGLTASIFSTLGPHTLFTRNVPVFRVRGGCCRDTSWTRHCHRCRHGREHRHELSDHRWRGALQSHYRYGDTGSCCLHQEGRFKC